MRRLLDERGGSDVEVASAGTAAYDGAPASEGGYLVALEHGLDLSPHRARALSAEAVAEADLILGMAVHHVERAEALGGTGRTHLVGAYAGRAPDEGQVSDPFGGDLEEYRGTYARLQELLVDVVARLMEEKRPGAGQGDQ